MAPCNPYARIVVLLRCPTMNPQQAVSSYSVGLSKRNVTSACLPYSVRHKK